ncbi:SLC13 family permease [Gemmatimonadota bacterium]
MTVDAWITLAVVLGTLALLARGKTGPAMIICGAVILLLGLGVVSPSEALSGFSNPAPFTVAALFVVARAVEKTGGLQPLLGALLGRRTRGAADKPLRWSLARLLGPVAAASAFLNNTPIVAMVSPQVEAWAERRKKSPSCYLMPLSFASILGGVVTVIGTSTTIVVSGLLESHGMPAIGMFEISRIGLPLALAGILFLILFSPLLLPNRRGSLREFEEEYREYTVNMVVTPGGPFDGKTVGEGQLMHLEGVFLAEVRRGDEIIAPASPQTHLQGGDLLTFAARSDMVLDLKKIRGLASAEAEHTLEVKEPGHTYFEVVVGADSPLAGRSLSGIGFRQEYRAVVLALHRSGERYRGKLAQVRLRAGDTLILLAGPRFRTLWRHRRDFLLISHLGGSPPTSTKEATLVAAVLVGIVSLAASGVLPVLQGSLLGAFLLVAARVMTPRETMEAVDLGVVFLIAGAFGIGAAIEGTGLASTLSEGVMTLAGGFGVTGALAGVLITTIILTEIITNNAAAVLVFPIAVATAGSLGVDPRPFAVAIAVGASASFLTPIGYQTNTMVYGPGGYRFGDYARLGFPLTLLVVVLVLWLVPRTWGF